MCAAKLDDGFDPRRSSRACGRVCGWALLLGCGGAPASAVETGSTTGDTETETGDELGCEDPPTLPDPEMDPVPWSTVGEVEIADDGASTSVSVSVPADARYLAIRSVALDGDEADNQRLCHDLLEARLVDADRPLFPADGEPLADTDQRRVPGPGAGVFVFSNTADPLLAAGVSDTLELRLQMRHCGAGSKASRAFFPGMATRVRIDVASEPGWDAAPSPATPARLAVRMLIAEDSGWGPTSVDAELEAAWSVAVERFAGAAIELELEAEATFAPTGVLDYDATMQTLRSLDADALACLSDGPDDPRFVPVVLVACLRPADLGVSSVLGQTTRIPGSFGDATSPSLVVLASGSCNLDRDAPAPSRDPERHGLILAHELGHYLGLHHIDSELGQHLASGPDAALMDSGIVQSIDPQAAWFSAAEAEVLLRHPALRFP